MPLGQAYLQLPHSLLGSLQLPALFLKLAPEAPALVTGNLEGMRKGCRSGVLAETPSATSPKRVKTSYLSLPPQTRFPNLEFHFCKGKSGLGHMRLRGMGDRQEAQLRK